MTPEVHDTERGDHLVTLTSHNSTESMTPQRAREVAAELWQAANEVDEGVRDRDDGL